MLWAKHGCFSRRPIKGAKNCMDARNVVKWKVKIDENGKTIRLIRVRMALRGFKDWDAISYLSSIAPT